MLLLTVLRLMPVFPSVNVTAALGITASDVSATAPVTFPVACCANRAVRGSRSTATSSTRDEAVGLILEKVSIICFPPVGCIRDHGGGSPYDTHSSHGKGAHT